MTHKLNPDHTAQHQPTPAEQYILQECGQLRDEIWVRVQDQRSTERYMLFAFAVVYSFLALQELPPLSEEMATLTTCAWFVPPVLAFLAAMRWDENVRLINRIADYTQTREQEILGPRGGWEIYLKEAHNGRRHSVLLSQYYVAFWLLLIGSTMAIAVYQQSFVTTWRLATALLIGFLAATGTLALIARTWIGCVWSRQSRAIERLRFERL